MRNLNVDFLRGVGIFAIVWSHISLGVLLDEIVNPIVLGMFFILSGMFYRDLPWQRLLGLKCRRLLVPWLIFVMIGYGYHWLYSFVDAKPFDYGMLLTDLCTGGLYRANIPCWFLVSLLQVTLIYAFIDRHVLSTWKRIAVLLVLLAVGIVMLDKGRNPFYMGKSLFYVSLFAVGDKLMKSPRHYTIIGGGNFLS